LIYTHSLSLPRYSHFVRSTPSQPISDSLTTIATMFRFRQTDFLSTDLSLTPCCRTYHAQSSKRIKLCQMPYLLRLANVQVIIQHLGSFNATLLTAFRNKEEDAVHISIPHFKRVKPQSYPVLYVGPAQLVAAHLNGHDAHCGPEYRLNIWSSLWGSA
jgi:hypothetical protein